MHFLTWNFDDKRLSERRADPRTPMLDPLRICLRPITLPLVKVMVKSLSPPRVPSLPPQQQVLLLNTDLSG